ncbi:MFS transporter [Pseudolabrys taiwanensis]|uniref:MFS transporter n=2 Tax=Pseudolabrys taiwanensis TaxID=331696 RepID=A0A346A439_9HYPH|nr:MFS transporter [Pseudolabrys taiwanensis]AXK83936.1 MFS transporter [Pseudolabrys taiwanensis]
MLGNIVTGLAVLAPAGMLADLATGLNVGIHEAGLLVTYGAVVLCIGSPVMAWLTTRIDRRVLLVATLAVMAVGQTLSAFAPNYATILIVRVAMLTIAAIFTPQAAAAIGLIVPEKERSSAISFVFLGWSLAVAGGLPLITFIATHLGWRMAFGILGAAAVVVALLSYFALPRGLQGKPLSLLSFAEIGRSKRIVSILLLTLVQTSGQFTVFIYFAPLLVALAGADATTIGGFFALYGATGLLGNIIASAVVTRFGIERTLAGCLAAIVIGMALWAAGAGLPAVMGIGVGIWGLGFASINSMQQARLAVAAPDLTSASIAMNTSILYVGQAIGSGVGGALFATGHVHLVGYTGFALIVAAAVLLVFTWQQRPAAQR